MTSPVRVSAAESFLASLSEAKRYLAECSSVDEAKFVRDKAEAMRVWARARGDARELEVHAGELRVRAERRMGELLPPKMEPQEHGALGGRGKSSAGQTTLPKQEAARLRAIAAIPAPVFEAHVAKAVARNEAPATKPLLRLARRREVVAKAASEMAASEPGFYRELAAAPSGRYRTIYADPPWSYDDEGIQGSAAGHYATMSLDGIASLDVARLAHVDGAHLWLWTTWPMLREAAHARVLSAWGFSWSSELVWDKERFGVGRWLRKQTEILILAARGRIPLLSTDEPDILRVARGAHSQKPPEARALVERCSPGPRIELFARRVPAGWDAFGNQIERVA